MPTKRTWLDQFIASANANKKKKDKAKTKNAEKKKKEKKTHSIGRSSRRRLARARRHGDLS
jgi:hypothetical protein